MVDPNVGGLVGIMEFVGKFGTKKHDSKGSSGGFICSKVEQTPLTGMPFSTNNSLTSL